MRSRPRSPRARPAGRAGGPRRRPPARRRDRLPERSAFWSASPPGASQAGVSVGPGADGVDEDALARVRVREQARERQHGGLRDAVVRHARRRALARRGGDVDDARLVGGAQVRQGRACTADVGEHVELEGRRIHSESSSSHQLRGARRADVVDEHVEAAEALDARPRRPRSPPAAAERSAAMPSASAAPERARAPPRPRPRARRRARRRRRARPRGRAPAPSRGRCPPCHR